MPDKLTLLLVLIFLAAPSWSQQRSTHSKIFDSSFMTSQQTLGLVDSQGNKRHLVLNSRFGEEELRRERRSIVLIQNSEHLNDLPEPLVKKIRASMDKNQDIQDYYIFANFVHSSLPDTDKINHYIAVVPRDIQVETLLLQVERFGNGLGAQTQLRFILNKGFKLIPQESDSYPILKLEKGDLIYSLQTTGPHNRDSTWNPLKGLTGEFANALEFSSTEAVAKQKIATSIVESYEFADWNRSQKKAVFDRALINSHHEQEKGIYNLVFNSGVTHTLLALKAGHENIRTAHFNPYSVVAMLEKSMGTRLKHFKSLNEEFGFLVPEQDDLMSWQKIQKQTNYQQYEPLLDLLQQPSFELVLREVSEFILEQKMTYPIAQQTYQRGSRSSERETATLGPKQLGSELWQKVESAWKARFPSRDTQEFFKILETLRPQDQ